MGIVNFAENDNFPDNSFLQIRDFMAFWIGMSDQQTIAGPMMGMSIYILFVVYQGNRFSHRRINGWNIDSVILFWGVFSMTALVRAVFAFFSQQAVLRIKNKYLNNPQPN